jgi:hypothetical protein
VKPVSNWPLDNSVRVEVFQKMPVRSPPTLPPVMCFHVDPVVLVSTLFIRSDESV